jgi:hypothetical protein
LGGSRIFYKLFLKDRGRLSAIGCRQELFG